MVGHAHKLIVYGIDESLENRLNKSIKLSDEDCKAYIHDFCLELENDVKRLMLRKGYLLSSSKKIQQGQSEFDIREFKKYGDLIAVTQVNSSLVYPMGTTVKKTVKETVFCTTNPSKESRFIFSELMNIYDRIGMIYHDKDKIIHIAGMPD